MIQDFHWKHLVILSFCTIDYYFFFFLAEYSKVHNLREACGENRARAVENWVEVIVSKGCSIWQHGMILAESTVCSGKRNRSIRPRLDGVRLCSGTIRAQAEKIIELSK